MPGRRKSIKWIPAHIDNPRIRLGNRLRQGCKWNMGGKKPWLRELGEVREVVVGIKLVLEERDKVMRIRGV